MAGSFQYTLEVSSRGDATQSMRTAVASSTITRTPDQCLRYEREAEALNTTTTFAWGTAAGADTAIRSVAIEIMLPAASATAAEFLVQTTINALQETCCRPVVAAGGVFRLVMDPLQPNTGGTLRCTDVRITQLIGATRGVYTVVLGAE